MAGASDERYIINRLQSLKGLDCSASKSWIVTAKTLFSKSFFVHFEAYRIEKEANNYEGAAECFNHLITTFQNQNDALWAEIEELTTALRGGAENEITSKQVFYLKMFKYVSYEVQHKMLLLTVNHAESCPNQFKILLTLLKQFPQSAVVHSPMLLEVISEAIKKNAKYKKYQDSIVEEILILILYKSSDLHVSLVCRLFTLILEYYIQYIVNQNCDLYETWRKIFEVLSLTGKILDWKPFLPFNKNWGQNIYWEKLFEIASTSPASSSQVLFYATTLFVYSLHCYIKKCNTFEDLEVSHLLVEGFTEDWRIEQSSTKSIEPPQISLSTPSSKQISRAFVHAAQCWQLLNTEEFQHDFSKLLLKLPLSSWISRFLFDLAIYFGHEEEAKKLMADVNPKCKLVHNLQLLSLDILHGSLSVQGFKNILEILSTLPTTQGKTLEHLTLKVPRHMIFLPLTQKAIVHYCSKAIAKELSKKMYEPDCPDQVLGDILVLLQLEYPAENFVIEQIFSIISSRHMFRYDALQNYIVAIDFIEEFMNIWHNGEFDIDISSSTQAQTNHVSTILNTHRINLRADKGTCEIFRSFIKQTLKSNDNLTLIIASFIQQEHYRLLLNLFGTEGITT